MLPPTASSTQVDFRTTVSEGIEDAVSGELMTKAVTLVPCGHTFNKDTVIQCLARNKLCPLDREPIERYVRNYTVRQLAEAAKSHPLEEIKQKPSEEAQEYFLRGKELCEKNDNEAAIEALLHALKLSPFYEKAQAYLEFCLKRSSKPSSQPLSLSKKGKEKISSSSAKEDYIELLFNLLEESSVQEHPSLKHLLESQLQVLVSQESEKLTVKEQEGYKWTKNLLGEGKKVRLFTVQKLQQVAMAILYEEILHFHFPEERENLAEKASILDSIYEIDPSLANEAKVPLIFENLFKKAQFLSPLEFEDNNQKKEPFTLPTYASYLLNINRLLLWQKLPGGKDCLNQAEMKALPLKQKGELFKEWIKEHGKNVSKLDLFNSSLTFLAPEIGQLSNLKALDLTQNHLTVLPTTIGQLIQLTVLNLGGNQLTSLPDTIGQLPKLEELYLSQNKLTSLPDTIGQLSKLQQLNLWGNQLTSLPDTIGQLIKLEELYLNQNKLTALLDTIGQLSKLQRLNLEENQLASLPDTIGQLSKLKGLYLSQNELASLPDTIGQLSELSTLDLGENQLTALPDTIGQLSKLSALHLGENQLTALPDTIGQLSKLQKLSLGENQLTALPDTIGQLTQLQLLELGGNQLKALPDTIGQLSKLSILTLWANQLTALPATIGQLAQLRLLDLEANQLRALPLEIKRLQECRICLDGNPLQNDG
ncbi:leucine-rich repeat domain-containing protein [Parachlamydia sp. AcF125]|uniref:leucine-rich repeat domain-containing protein n=1 Tax=Parachlamydia sp. AcF125 TaxID=2795736 RepID=UPI001BC9EBFD|nr:leucine-rich repeat domain-containing protein [Parachlamydia sp. AcF125]MBS4168649.1 E3 ubiquitin-protein ligase SspH2 [Parachlamydia sp. AcF125]